MSAHEFEQFARRGWRLFRLALCERALLKLTQFLPVGTAVFVEERGECLGGCFRWTITQQAISPGLCKMQIRGGRAGALANALQSLFYDAGVGLAQSLGQPPQLALACAIGRRPDPVQLLDGAAYVVVERNTQALAIAQASELCSEIADVVGITLRLALARLETLAMTRGIVTTTALVQGAISGRVVGRVVACVGHFSGGIPVVTRRMVNLYETVYEVVVFLRQPGFNRSVSKNLTQIAIIAPLAAVAMVGVCSSALADDIDIGSDYGLLSVDALDNPFELDARALDPIQFSRVPDVPEDVPLSGIEHLTEFSFELKPQRPDFSRRGLYGLGLIGRPSVEIHSSVAGADDARLDLNDGFAYSAGVRVEHEDAVIDGTAYVSSSLLGLSYGRLGRLWYGGIDVNVEQFREGIGGEEPAEIVSLDLTTGRRLGFTGLDSTSPLWLLSLQGNVDLQEAEQSEDEELKPEWFLNPSLFWEHPGFTFSAEMQVPVTPHFDEDADDPDYRLRAIFEKRFR